MYSLCIKDTRAQNQWGNYFLSSASSAPSKDAYWTGAIQLQKGEQHLGKLHRETVSHAFWGWVTILRVEQGLLTAGVNL